jgi:CheY-like chemotaxis protein
LAVRPVQPLVCQPGRARIAASASHGVSRGLAHGPRLASYAHSRAVSGFTLASNAADSRACPVVIRATLCDDWNVQLTVLIVDDHPAFRASARTLLEDEGYEVVGEAEDGESGLRLARKLEPDLVLLDIALPDLSGLEVAERLSDAPSKVLLTSSRRPSDLGSRLQKSTALGFISKDDLSGEALEELLKGRT